MHITALNSIAAQLAAWIQELPYAKPDPNAACFVAINNGAAKIYICATTSPEAIDPENEQHMPAYDKVRRAASQLEVAGGHGLRVFFYLSSAGKTPDETYFAGLHAGLVLISAAHMVKSWYNALQVVETQSQIQPLSL